MKFYIPFLSLFCGNKVHQVTATSSDNQQIATQTLNSYAVDDVKVIFYAMLLWMGMKVSNPC